MRTQEAFTISLLDCARKNHLTFKRTWINGSGLTEHVFHSPLRKDKNASLYINDVKNVWYDNGGAIAGGGIIAFINYLNGNRLDDTVAALQILDGLYPELKHPSRQHTVTSGFTPNGEILQKITSRITPQTAANGIKEKNALNTVKPAVFEVVKVKPLFSYPLKNYLTQERQLDLAICQHYVKEVVYRHIARDLTLYGIGFKSGATWVIRSKGFKGFLGQGADLSIYDRHTASILLFEGFTDFLSYLTAQNTPKPAETCITLNSAIQIKKLIHYVQANPHIHTIRYFRDRDEAGFASLLRLQEALPGMTIQDKSQAYSQHNDLNDWLVHRQQTEA